MVSFLSTELSIIMLPCRQTALLFWLFASEAAFLRGAPATTNPPLLLSRARPRAVAHASGALDDQLAEERAAVQALRESVKELEQTVQEQREKLASATPSPPPPPELTVEPSTLAAVAPSPASAVAPSLPTPLSASVFDDFVDEVERAVGIKADETLRTLLRSAWSEAAELQRDEIERTKRSVQAISDFENQMEELPMEVTQIPPPSPAIQQRSGADPSPSLISLARSRATTAARSCAVLPQDLSGPSRHPHPYPSQPGRSYSRS